MNMNTSTTIEQIFLKLLRMDYNEWIINRNKEIILKNGKNIEKLNNISLYDKIINDIELAFVEKQNDNTLLSTTGFLYGKLVKIVFINDDITKCVIRFIQKNDFTNKKSNLAELRRNSNMSQAQLAIKTGVSVATIRNYEQNPNTINTAQYQTLKIISQVLGVDIKDIIPSNETPYSLEQLYPNEDMLVAIQIIENYINMENKNICVYVTGTMGSGVSTITKSLASCIIGSTIVGDRLIIKDLYEENREMLCIQLRITQNNERIINSISLIHPHKNEILWQYQQNVHSS